MNDNGISFSTHVEYPELRYLCSVHASADTEAECAQTFLALADDVGLRLDPQAADITFSDHGNCWYARAMLSVERPSLPLGLTVPPQPKGQTSADAALHRKTSAQAIAALGVGSPVSLAIAALQRPPARVGVWPGSN